MQELKKSALHVAVDNNHIEVVKAVLDAGAFPDVQQPSTGDTPLHYAASTNRHDVVRVLLRAAANRSIVNDEGLTPLALAVRGSAKECIVLLAGPVTALQLSPPSPFSVATAVCVRSARHPGHDAGQRVPPSATRASCFFRNVLCFYDALLG